MNRGEVQVAKLTYTIDQLYDKYEALLSQLKQLEQSKTKRVAELSRKMFPRILKSNPESQSKKVRDTSML